MTSLMTPMNAANDVKRVKNQIV